MCARISVQAGGVRLTIVASCYYECCETHLVLPRFRKVANLPVAPTDRWKPNDALNPHLILRPHLAVESMNKRKPKSWKETVYFRLQSNVARPCNSRYTLLARKFTATDWSTCGLVEEIGRFGSTDRLKYRPIILKKGILLNPHSFTKTIIFNLSRLTKLLKSKAFFHIWIYLCKK